MAKGAGGTKKRSREELKDSEDLYHNDKILQHPPTKRAKEVDSDPPYEELREILDKQSKEPEVKAVLHWFRSKDLRIEDNKALHAASNKAKEAGVPLLTMYLHSPQDLEWHGTSAARSDFLIRCLEIMQKQLKEKNIPLAIVTAEDRHKKTDKVIEFCSSNKVSHIFANYEYEVDELRRDIDLLQSESFKDIHFELLHDQTVVEPGTVHTGSGGPMKVFTPYHKEWVVIVANDPSLLDLVDEPEANDKSVTNDFAKLFDNALPKLPESKQFASDDDKERIRKLWPAGHEAGIQRMQDFIDKKLVNYEQDRSKPAKDGSSRMSCYFSTGAVSVREVLAKVKEWNDNEKNFNNGDGGAASWVREVVFREFYRQTMINVPHGGMNLPQNLKFDFVNWEDDEEGWRKWCEGKLGVPFVDAGMRQLNHEGYMHNRLRMNTASYLRANLLIDYRRGERYFAEHLIDWDLSNNTNGWEPSYTLFNPVPQAKRWDKDGEYIKKWVPELKDLSGAALFEPHKHHSKEELEEMGYCWPHVDWDESAARAKDRYKSDMAGVQP